MQPLFLLTICAFPFALLAAGLLLLFKGASDITRGAGAFAIFAGALTGAALMRGIRLSDLLHPTAAPQPPLSQLELRHVGIIRDFLPGDAELSLSITATSSASQMEISQWVQQSICTTWKGSVKDRGKGLILLIGATDRVPLTDRSRKRYESNVGLAQARADRVSALIANACAVPADRLLSLVAGPRNTPAEAQKADYGEDRNVDIWVLWNSDDLNPAAEHLATISLHPAAAK